jgi:hypothetical protein
MARLVVEAPVFANGEKDLYDANCMQVRDIRSVG